MATLNFIVKNYLSPIQKRVEYVAQNPIEIQQKLLFTLIKKAQKTTYGKAHHFDEINSIASFVKHIPINDYESLKPHIQKMILGEQNILWPETITWFSKSSGTTNDRSKFIPVSKSSLRDCHIKGPKDLMSMYYRNNPTINIFDGKGIVMGGSLDTFQENANANLGDVSAIMTKKQPYIANLIRRPSKKIALMSDWKSKIDKTAESTINQNITNIAGVPSWTLVLLNRILEITGKSVISEVWPNLQLYIHGGVNFEPYQNTFKQILGNEQMHYYQSYNASEGFFAFQDRNDANDMLLSIDSGVYYEFIPQGEWNKEQPKVVQLADVSINVNYALVVTTNSGLWRYKVGDTIQFIATQPYRIKVTGRTKHFINAFGEEVIINNTDNAIMEACKQTKASIHEYTVAPKYFGEGKTKACHQWLIEFKIPPLDIEAFAKRLDDSLRSLNSDYDAKRQDDMALKMPEVIIARKNLFYQWLEQRGKLGGQNKIPRLSNDRKYMTELLAF